MGPQLIGHGFNGVTGDYSYGASGFRIVKGEIARPVAEFTVAGNIVDMFRTMSVADDLDIHRAIDVQMTLTTPNCPAAGDLPNFVENAVASVPGVGPVTVNVVWEPAWTPDRMSDEARLVLNMW